MVETSADKPEILAFSDDAIARVVEALQADQPVALPTETVYGLAANAASADAVAAIYRAKGRPDFNPLIVHVPDVSAARTITHFNAMAETLAKAFWPGPLTMVLPLSDNGRAKITPAVTAGLDTIALRCPAHRAMQTILHGSSLLLAAPSANRSGAISPTAAAHVATSLQDRIDLVLDDGPCSAGVESTIVGVTGDGWRILRPGPIAAQVIIDLLGIEPIIASDDKHITAPGQMASHYAPTKPLQLATTVSTADQWLIGFGEIAGDDTLSARGDLAEAAARLYAALHRADASDRKRIGIAPIPDSGIGTAINDRLRRAASKH
ncbi:L-threonylcarbamoyladenylate synthase [Alterisphingorhabdus coralli]|uniref:Threonylcarbamoyl-AMP synthase n=1 Tax=Alterisphingorhabdus coralli TaxID=3071408 RepID=A0AA97F9C6_9SPHN|nr:L-threonylcarbamoyladenylate synthase [Parasphingorhabdus sp. SCSIO 66989]WOE74875.1 L-threonylcarbamoyladenylate synthase [Parasphingorhabdus sp. SCSIO 66989]